jgi:hypothetical protein
MGARGMPRRYWDYDPQYQIFHQLSTIGAFVLGISIFVTVIYLMASFWTGKRAPRNPWGGSSLEWSAPSPPPLYNFEKPPVLHEIYNYDDLVEIEEDRWVRQSEIDADKASAKAKAETKAEVAKVEAKAVEAKTEAKAEEVKPAEAKVEAAKVEAKPAEAKVEAKPAEAEVKAEEAKPEAKAEEAKVEAKAEEAKAEDAKPEAKAEGDAGKKEPS